MSPTMAGFPEDFRVVFRALAEAKAGPFQDLYVSLPWTRPTIPKSDFDIFRMADSQDARVVVGVDAWRPDGIGVMWSVRLDVASSKFEVSAGVEITDEDGNVDEVF